MSGTLMAKAKELWGENSFILSLFGIAVAGALLLRLVLSPSPPSPRDVAIQEIAATQRSMLVEQQKTNSLLGELIKAQEHR